MSYATSATRAACTEGCCLVGRDPDYPAPNPMAPGSQYARPMFSVIRDLERHWVAVDYAAEKLSESFVLIEYGEIVGDWDWERPDPRTGRSPALTIPAKSITAGVP